ncbi:MAG: sigma-70 family RNA polymerase sigma factor [Planctomycetes bacterium]|nr:sigma-70 family RNA polymerase sigma factor [Planctomycetota bacterium]
MTKIDEKTGEFNLIGRAKHDRDALATLYRRYYDRILRFCMYRLFDQAAAEDVTSEVFLSVARTIRSFAGSTEPEFSKWIYTIANNMIITHIRKTTRRSQLLATAVESGRLGTSETDCDQQNIESQTLHQAILSLTPQHQTLIVMRFFEKMTPTAIAEILDTKPVTVRVGLTRALRKLKKILPNNFWESK